MPGLPLSKTKCGNTAVELSLRFFNDIGAKKLLLSSDVFRRPPNFSANFIPSPVALSKTQDSFGIVCGISFFLNFLLFEKPPVANMTPALTLILFILLFEVIDTSETLLSL